MQNIHDIIREIRERSNKTGFSVQVLAVLAGIGVNTLNRMWHEDWSPTIDTIDMLQNYLKSIEHLSPEELRQMAKDKELRPPKPGRYKIRKSRSSTKKLSAKGSS